MAGAPRASRLCEGPSGSNGGHEVCRAERVIAYAGVHLDSLGEKEALVALGEALCVQRLHQ